MHIIRDKPIKMHKLVAFLIAALAVTCGNAAAAAVRMHIIHTDAGRGLSPRELMHRMAQRSKARAARFLSDARSAPVTPGAIDGVIPDTEYLAHFAIGTPAQAVQLTLDSGSDLVWTQCQPCITCFNQALPLFDSSLSSTFRQLSCATEGCQALPATSCDAGSSSPDAQPCGYGYSYGDGSVTFGALVADMFSFAGGPTIVAAFGCGLNNTGIFKSNETGIAGFGRGLLSLPSQLKVDNFSYCFTAITGSAPSPVLLGVPTDLFSSDPSTVLTTPLIQNPARPSYYYISLKGVTVGSTMLPIRESTFALMEDGTGGTIIDSGTGMTSFPPDVYNLVHDAFIAQTSLPVLNSTATPLCFTSSPGTKPDVPKLILHLDGATLDLPRENYIFDLEDASVSLSCLAVNPGGDITIIGNYQQQNMHVLYNLANNLLSFAPAQCDTV